MVKIDSTLSTLTISGALAIAISILVNLTASDLGPKAAALSGMAAQAADAPPPRPVWAASATGRVEPKEGEFRIAAPMPGRIVEVGVKTNDQVKAGDLLVRIDDEELFARRLSAEAEVLVREREREEEPAKGPAQERRNAEDTVAAAERALFAARAKFDSALAALRAGKGAASDVDTARNDMTAAKDKVASERAALEAVNARPGMPLPTRLESALTQARADLTLAETAIERARVRAPADGAILNVWAKAGETASPSPEAPLVLFGDLSSLRVRAELEERDVVKVRVGQRVVVRVDAYPERDFAGEVTSMSSALGAPRIASRGPRRPNDVEVLEVLIALDGQPPLLTGMRVDVYFASEGSAGPATN